MLDRRTVSTGLLAGAATSLLVGAGRAQAPVTARNVVLVHGAWADGSSWSEVIAHLQSAGFRATAVQNSLVSLADDVAATHRAIALQDGPTVLVAHSYAGTVVTQAGVDPKVSAVVYVAARAPDLGEDYTELTTKFPAAPVGAGIVKSDGFIQLSEEAFLRDFANGVAPSKARVLFAVQGPISDKLFSARTSSVAWKAKPSWYAVSRQDRAINPDLQRFFAKRMNATTIELDAGHLSLVSHPKEIADLIKNSAGRRS
ncbi:alpha/beta fold hydrolase [uncultured Enterovirga sp.]|uniref:alpha/beta fold hydrolase n=1 Tax=uncultured Enterovirga sp. TaxID=2026352 RepID=UPI0035CC6542